MGDEAAGRLGDCARGAMAVIGVSKRYVASCSDDELEVHAKEEEKIFYEGMKVPGDICKNAYSQYHSVFEDLSDPFARMMTEALFSKDGLGGLSVGCRLTGKECMSLIGRGREEPRSVKLLVPDNIMSEYTTKREIFRIYKGAVGDCPGYNVDKEKYESVMRGCE